MAQADAPLGYPADATTTVPTTHAPTIILQMKMRWYDPGGDIAMPRTVSIMTSRMVLSIFNIPPVGCDVPDCEAASLSQNCKVKLAGVGYFGNKSSMALTILLCGNRHGAGYDWGGTFRSIAKSSLGRAGTNWLRRRIRKMQASRTMDQVHPNERGNQQQFSRHQKGCPYRKKSGRTADRSRVREGRRLLHRQISAALGHERTLLAYSITASARRARSPVV